MADNEVEELTRVDEKKNFVEDFEIKLTVKKPIELVVYEKTESNPE